MAAAEYTLYVHNQPLPLECFDGDSLTTLASGRAASKIMSLSSKGRVEKQALRPLVGVFAVTAGLGCIRGL